LLDRLGHARWPSLLRGDKSWGIEPVMAGAEQRGLPYLFRLRLTMGFPPGSGGVGSEHYAASLVIPSMAIRASTGVL
jgi:hypothetical protein